MTVTATAKIIQRLRDQKDWSQDDLGKSTGLGQNAIWKLENGKMPFKLDHLTRIARALNVNPAALLPDEFDVDNSPPLSVAETEAAPYDAGQHAHNRRDIAAFAIGDNPNRSAWVQHSDALTGAGVLQGDILILDQTEKPRSGGIVCAQLYSGTIAETKFRIYHPPYLLAANTDSKYRAPILIDGRSVQIMGAVTDIIRSPLH